MEVARTQRSHASGTDYKKVRLTFSLLLVVVVIVSRAELGLVVGRGVRLPEVPHRRHLHRDHLGHGGHGRRGGGEAEARAGEVLLLLLAALGVTRLRLPTRELHSDCLTA